MTNKTPDNPNNELDKFFEEFDNRKIYEEITLEILASLPDDELEEAIFDYVVTKFTDFETSYEVVSQMSPGLQMVYSTLVLEGEVNNGGFNQFFFNSSGQYADMALRSLKLIGAHDYAQILEIAIAIHTKEKGNRKLQDLYSKRTIPAFFSTYELTSLGKCDDEFYELGDTIYEMRIQYIRSNPDDFIGA